MLREAFYYLLGGITFLPLCLIVILLRFYLTVPSEHQSGPPSLDADIELTHEKKLAALDLAARNAAIHAEIEKAKGKDQPQGDATAPATAKRLGGPSASSTPKPFSSGWLTVRPTFESDKDAAGLSGAGSAPAAIPASLIDTESGASRDHSEDEATPVHPADTVSTSSNPTPKPNAANAGSGYMSQMYRGILDYRIGRGGAKKSVNDASSTRSTTPSNGSTSTPTGTSGKESFYCILKSPILYLYSSDDVANPNTECHAAIDLRGKRVSIFVHGIGDTIGDIDPEHPASLLHTSSTDDDEKQAFDPKQAWKRAKRAGVRDGELFMKRNAIRIVGSAVGRNSSSSRASKSGRRRPQWFIFCKNNYIMEDWYHALLQASLTPDPTASATSSDDAPVDPLSRLFAKLDDPIGPTFSQDDMASLLVSLDSLPDPLPLRWLNALVGRIFFSIYRTAWLEDYIVSKMMKKMNRVKTPGFLGDIKVVEVDVGRRAPGFSRPMLKALTSEGEASMEVALHYVGEIRITISTTLTLSLGSRFKTYSIPIVLAVVLRSLEGNLLLHVKRPPSNRLWFGFTTMPKMEIDIEPVVSERKVQWGMVTRLIESRIRELLQESIVVPNMDDISFFDTRSLPLRGGIFADAAKASDMKRGGVHDSSTTAEVAAPAAASVLQGQDVKSTAMDVKTSDLLAANKVGTASAPVSGAATPTTSDRPGASTDLLADRDSEASSISTAGVSTSAMRNRKGGLEPSTLLKDPSALAARTSSPAAAGLSDLLNRDLAAGGSPPRQDLQGGKRRTWFGAGPKTSASSSISSSSGLSSLGLGAAALGGRSNREQSSLALGNASIERPSQRAHSASVSARSDSTLSVPTDGSVRAVSDSAPRSASTHPIQPESSKDADAVASQMHDEMLPSAVVGVRLHPESSRDVKDGRSSQSDKPPSATPSLLISSAPEPVPPIADSVPSSRLSRAALEAPHSDEDDRDLVDSPSSFAPSTRSSVRSFGLDGVSPDSRQKVPGDATVARAFEAFNDAESADASHQNSMLSGEKSNRVSESNVSRSMPPPPPPRKPTSVPRDDRPVPRQDATSALSSVQRNRYGLNEGERGSTQTPDGLPSSTSTMLLTSWNKARASMADKESRQAAARDAKDAIKRGWANWNTKRTEARRGNQADEDVDEPYNQAGMTRSQSSRLSLVPGRSAWLASSPPDPTSFGLGFDKSSPEDTRAAARDKHASTANYYANMRSNLTDTDDDNASTHSNSSNRQPYRELRASKKVHGFDSSSTERPSSRSSSNFASTTLDTAAASSNPVADASSWSGKWDADVPSLTPPALAFRKERDEDDGPEPKRNLSERASSKEGPSPPALPQRKPSSSILSTSQSSSGGVSFIPPAPAATTELASVSGLSDHGVSPATGESAVRAQSFSAKQDPALSTDFDATGPRTPERAKAGERASPSNKPDSRRPSQVIAESLGQTAAEGAEESKAKAPEAAVVSELSSSTAKELGAVGQEQKDAATEASAPEKDITKAEQPHVAAPAEVSSPSLGSGIKKQPGRATMMAVPGIPSMQKAGPQSFSAPPPPEQALALKSDAETSPSAFRASSLFKMPTFGSPVLAGAGGGAKGGSGARTADDASPSRSSLAESPAKQSTIQQPPPIPARPGTESQAGGRKAAAPSETSSSALGLTQMDQQNASRQGSISEEPVQDSLGEGGTVPKMTSRSSLTEPRVDGDAQEDKSANFAQVAKAEGPAADPDFEQAQVDAGETVNVGDREVKLPTSVTE
ncbi:Nucleus-vacuole junction protein 2 [Pseudozyma hubeiensis]|nr:Nucleus-vacuole junction protein 2 [Pseudozyma hubeiensis]